MHKQHECTIWDQYLLDRILHHKTNFKNKIINFYQIFLKSAKHPLMMHPITVNTNIINSLSCVAYIT
ncbi:hypothetical protein BpHYR1_038569 [Brachionus plicatilis]|uniref:Uncharacterized protein n=1 Tax=Brachionus plicatilis TaxID=10195 RepID=A0A3M7PLF2_BRAPC|nr:hypothetical protein BpHYR1_038569 [Brachionus plicatilis]